jgi:hypothetical protein
MTEIGTCPVCGRRYAVFHLATSGELALLHHNDRPQSRCAGAGGPPVAGSVSYQVAGRRIERGERQQPCEADSR